MTAATTKIPVLFIAESVTLAQIVRLRQLAAALDSDRYEVHFASSNFPSMVFDGTAFRRWNIRSISPKRLEFSQKWGLWPYSKRVLEGYVAEERELLRTIRPRAVIGDLRLSLTVSAPLESVPYAALINAYWSPYSSFSGLPVPDHPLVTFFGEAEVARGLHKVERHVLRGLARPVNALRRRHGLAPFVDIKEALTHGDLVLYADTSALALTSSVPSHHHFLGPVLWAPEVEDPPWWNENTGDRPWIYVTLGSSGRTSLLPVVIEALSRLPVVAMVASAGARLPGTLPPNVRVAPYLRGDRAAARSAFVIANGGSTTGYQALAAGAPVLGLPWNMDQYLAMRAITHAGAGVVVRSGSATVEKIRGAAEKLLYEPGFREAASRIASQFSQYDAARRFSALVERLSRC